MKRKIILSLLALFIFFTIGTAIAMFYITDTTSELNRIIQLHEVEQRRRSLVIDLKTVQSHLYTINTPFEFELDTIVNNVMNLEDKAAECSSCHHPKKLVTRIINMQSLLSDYETHLSYFITLRANSERLQDIKKEAAAIGNKIITMTESMSHSATNTLTAQTAEAMLTINNVKIILLITLSVTLLLAIAVAVRLTKSITRPVKALLNATSMIASGELGSTIAYKDKTEFGELAEHFNTMSAAVKDEHEKTQNEITERRQTEEALRKSEERLQSVFNQMQDVFFRADTEGLFIWVSPSVTTMLGFKSHSDVIGHNISDFFTSEEVKRDYFLTLSDKGKIANYEAELRRRDGKTLIVSLNSHFYLNENGDIEGIQGVCRDITEGKKLEEEHLKIEKLESLGILAGGIAHDFNNILTTIAGNIAHSKMVTKSGGNTYEILTDAEKACHRATDLTKQLLTFSKGGTPIKRTTSIKKQLEDWARFALRGANTKCELSIQSDLWNVEVDEGQINQVIFNLLINAKQAMPDGGMIRLSAENVNIEKHGTVPRSSRDHIKISIRDNGAGISREHIKNIFDPYFTTKQEGSGLGLSSTYSIIKKHDGFIDVESELGLGTAFHIYLPAVRGKAPARNKKPDTFSGGHGKILLMDDDEFVLSTVCKTLSTLGYNVQSSRDGVEAIELYKNALASDKPIDVVIMDLTIRGGMGGEKAIEELIKIDPDVKAIVSSGYSTDAIMANYREYGFSGVIPKPYDIEDLCCLLNGIIEDNE